jgi:tubulin--tyrosine ligase-like protein 12
MSESNDAGVFESFLALHEAQLRASGVPERFFKSLQTKLQNQIFDAGEFFQLLLLDYGEEDRGEKDPIFTVVGLKDIKADDPNAIFLVDHALTFKTDILRKQLTENSPLLNRLSIMMGLPVNDDVEQVMTNIWRFSNFYSINAQGEILQGSDSIS